MVAQKWAPHHLARRTYRQSRRDGVHNKQNLRTRHRVGDQVVAKTRSACSHQVIQQGVPNRLLAVSEVKLAPFQGIAGVEPSLTRLPAAEAHKVRESVEHCLFRDINKGVDRGCRASEEIQSLNEFPEA